MARKKTEDRKPGRPGKFTVWNGKTQVAAEGYQRITFFVPDDMAAKLRAVAGFRRLGMSELLIEIVGESLKKVKVQL